MPHCIYEAMSKTTTLHAHLATYKLFSLHKRMITVNSFAQCALSKYSSNIAELNVTFRQVIRCAAHNNITITTKKLKKTWLSNYTMQEKTLYTHKNTLYNSMRDSATPIHLVTTSQNAFSPLCAAFHAAFLLLSWILICQSRSIPCAGR